MVACDNEWLQGICNKPHIKCQDCNHRQFSELSNQVIYHHLAGKQIVGIHPLLHDNTCYLLVADFDKGHCRDKVKAMSKACPMVTDAIGNWQQPLTLERLLQWHAWLFPEDHALMQRVQGGQLRDEEPMQVVSGRPYLTEAGRPKVHFEAPPRDVLESELHCLIDWFDRSKDDTKLDPLLRAGIAHFWFITTHPTQGLFKISYFFWLNSNSLVISLSTIVFLDSPD